MSSATNVLGASSARPAAEHPPLRPQPALAAWTLCRREWVRFIRQPNRVIGALAQPIIFWILLGVGLGPSFRPAGDAPISYAQYYFSGTLVLILLFSAIFATISVIEDRREGFLQSVLVAPIPRWSMVAGKVLGGALIAGVHATIFLLLGLTILPMNLLTVVIVVPCLFIVGIALTSLGLAIAWRMNSVQGFHAIMGVFLLPMWLLSGAVFPPGDNWLGWIIRLNPLTYCVALLRWLLYANAPPAIRDAAVAGLPSVLTCVVVTVGFVLATFFLAWRVAAVRTSGDAI